MANCLYKSYLSRNWFSGERCGNYCDHESVWFVSLELLRTMHVFLKTYACFGISTVMLSSTVEKEEPFGSLLRGCVELLLDFVVCRFLLSTHQVNERLLSH